MVADLHRTDGLNGTKVFAAVLAAILLSAFIVWFIYDAATANDEMERSIDDAEVCMEYGICD